VAPASNQPVAKHRGYDRGEPSVAEGVL